MFVSELELKSQLEDWFEQSLFIRAGHRGVPQLCCSKRNEGRLSWCVVFKQSNEVDVEDKYLLPRIDIWMNQSFGAYVFSEIDVKSGCLRVSVKVGDV